MYWIREIAGWLLIALGVYASYLVLFVFLPNGKYIECLPTVIIGMVIFRGGIHLLKVAVAARVCRQAPMAELPKVTVSKPTLVKGRTVIPGKK